MRSCLHLSALVLALGGAPTSAPDLTIVTDEAEAALAILELRAADKPVPPDAWSRRKLVTASSREPISTVNGVSAPYRIVPVEKTRGPSCLPAFCSSDEANTSWVSADGSWMVVTPWASALK